MPKGPYRFKSYYFVLDGATGPIFDPGDGPPSVINIEKICFYYKDMYPVGEINIQIPEFKVPEEVDAKLTSIETSIEDLKRPCPPHLHITYSIFKSALYLSGASSIIGVIISVL
jgi:hypothetical protein